VLRATSQTPLRIDFTYTARDQVLAETRYSDLAGTQVVGSSQFTYDAAMRMVNLQQLNGSSSLLANYTYTYDLASRLTSETFNGNTISFSYDVLNEVTGDGIRAYSYLCKRQPQHVEKRRTLFGTASLFSLSSAASALLALAA
jgi:uncharacterized protein RhaS with RHS repeats